MIYFGVYLAGAMACAAFLRALSLFEDWRVSEYKADGYWMLLVFWPILIPILALAFASWVGLQVRNKWGSKWK